MRVALLKDPEIRARIEQSGFAETEDPGAHEVSDLPGNVAAPPATSPAQPTGPRPYLSEPR